MKVFSFQINPLLYLVLLFLLPAGNTGAQNYCAKVDYTHEVNGLEVRFEGSSPETVQEWYWHFGDNTPVTKGQKQNHTFTKEGTYDVCLKILVNESCTGAVCRKISIGTTTSPCELKPDFQYTVSGNQVKFSGTSTVGDNGKYYWSFGNGKSGEGREVSSGYVADGYYEVCMKVLAPATNASASCTDHICKKIPIGTGSGNDCDLKPDFQYTVSGNQVKFSGTSTVGDNGKYYWSFGNGTSGEGREISSSYAADGYYEVCMKVLAPATNAAASCTDHICKKIQIGTGSGNDCDLKPEFQYTVSGNQVKFSGTSTVGDNGKYYWSFGNGKSGEGREVSSGYVADGYYEVCMKVLGPAISTSTSPCTDGICKKIKIGNGCDLKAEFTFAHTGSDYTFKANSNAGSDARYYWSFGNGVSAEGQQVTNTYSTPGFYEVCLKVLGGPSTTAASQCVQSVCKKIQVGQDIQDCVLEADFKYTANGNQLTFRATSNDDKATYYWYGSDFSAANLTGREVTHFFQKDGIYEVCLVAVDGGQTCKVKVCKKVTVGDNIKVFPNPTSDFINFVSERRIIKAGIFDQMNKHMLVSEVNNTEGRIDVSGLVSGLYSVKLVLEDQSVYVATFYKN